MTKANCALKKAGRKTSLFLDKGKGVGESKDDIVKEKVEQVKAEVILHVVLKC